jgi:Tol biopolymer transport system component
VDPRISAEGQSIVFVRALNEVTRDLYRTTPEGGAATRLTFDNRKINGLAWSPDGKRLLFTSTRSGMYGLWSADPDGGDLRQLPIEHDGVQQPATAAGVHAIAFEHWNHRSQLRLLDLATRAEADAGPFFGSTRWDSSPAWSPDGARIAFGSNRGGPHAIWVSRADGRGAAAIADFEGAFIDNPAWSPDGRLIAFDGSPDGTSAIYVVAAEGGAPRRITAGPGDSRHPAWSADGAWLYYESNRDGQWRVHAQPLAGGPAVVLTDGPAVRPRESADGRWLLHARPDAGGLWRIARRDWRSATPAPGERLEVDLRAGDADRWVPAGAGIYFVRRPPGSPPQLSLFDPLDGSIADVLMLAPEFAGTGLELSPDQGRLLFSEPSSYESDLRLAVMRD